MRLHAWDIVALVLLVIGGLNWGLYGVVGLDVVAALFGTLTWLSRLIYILVGLSAIYAVVRFPALTHTRERRAPSAA